MTAGTSDGRAPGAPSVPVGAILGWGVTLLLLGYAYLIHQGLGPPPGGMVRPDQRWFEPTAFLLSRAPFDHLLDHPVGGVALAALPAALGVLVVLRASRSALARTLAVTCLFAVALFAFYGLVAARVWDFFKWRGSAVMVLTALCAGAAATAPVLAASWLRLRWQLRLVLYALVFFAVVALERNPTGTDEHLAFNFSPWPAVPIFGLEMGAYLFIGLWLGLAVALAIFATRRHRSGADLAGVALGVGIPVAWVALRFHALHAPTLLGVAVVAAVALALGALAGREDRRQVLLRRAGVTGLGALLAGLPLLTGRAWADADFAITRNVEARRISDALARYMADKDEYPDSLRDLVADGYLHRLPRPRIGFPLPDALGGTPSPRFSYQNLGSSYVLEFNAPEWVQCAYNPPWEDFDDEEGDDGGGAQAEQAEPGAPGDDEAMGDAWSCPGTRPDLW